MIEKKAIVPERIRKINGSFAFIEHRFIRDGFWASLNIHERLLYTFLVLVSDRNGLSYYGFDKLCTLLGVTFNECLFARNGLINKDLIAYDGLVYQVLSLPEQPVETPTMPLKTQEDMIQRDPATIRKIIRDRLNHD